MNATPEAIVDILHNLAEIPVRFVSLTGNLDDDRLNYKPERKSWSANENLAHLRACADIWGDSIEAMLEGDNPTLVHVSPRDWIKSTNYVQLPFQESLGVFTGQRRQLLAILSKLDFGDWSRGALIKGRQHTIFSQARRMAKHDAIHCDQIEELLNTIRNIR